MATVQASAPVAEKPQVPTSDDSAKNVAAAVGASTPAPINVASTSDTVAGEQANAGDKSEGKRGKNDKKPRRERPPLPDEIPTTPVKRYPEPSRSELQSKIDEHDAIIKDCFEKLAATRSFYDQRTKIREAGKAEFDGARKKLNQKNDECRVLFEKRKSLTLQIKNLREADISARTASSSSGGREENALKGLKTVQDVDERIAQLEYEQQTVSLSMQEEKKLISQISFLKHTGRDLIMAKDNIFKEEAAAKKSRAEQRTALEAERKELDTKIDEAKAALEELKKEVDGIRAKQDAEIKKLAEATADIDRDVIKTKIGEEKNAIRKLRDDFQVELDKWYLNERIHVEQQKIAKRKKWEAQNAEREARRKAWEEEQAQYPEPDPYQKEKDMCAGLTAYLQTLLGETVEKTSTKNLLTKSGAPTLKANDGTSARSISSAGKAIGKNTKSEEFEALAFSDFMQKKKKGKKGKRVSTSATPKATSGDDSDTPLKPCSIDLLAAFTHLEITPPKKFSEVRESLNAVKAKKEYYDSNPAPPKPEEAVKEPAPKAKQEKKSNGNAKAIADSSSTTAFPGLNSLEGSAPKAADAGAAGGSARPSFSDIAKGSAAAPSMGTSAFPATMITESVGASGVMGDSGLSNGNKHESSVAPQEIAFTES